MKKFVFAFFFLLLFILSTCSTKTSTKTPHHKSYNVCSVDQPFPYYDAPYVGIHGNAFNNERVTCNGPSSAPVVGWHALDYMLIFNPISVSKSRVYAVAARISGCKLWYINIDDGSEHCLTKNPDILSIGTLFSTPELDEDENVYVADGFGDKPDGVFSFTKSGDLRWSTSFEKLRKVKPSSYRPPLGVHFTPDGFVTTVTFDGIVVLLDRETGKILYSFNITQQTNLKPLKPERQQNSSASMPLYIKCRLEKALGGSIDSKAMSAFFTGSVGESGAYNDNTIAAAGDLLFVVGGGPDKDGDGYGDEGALVAIKITKTDKGPTLSLAWYVPLKGGSGTSPTVDPTGKYVVVSDTDTDGKARVVVADIDKCNKVIGSDDPVCDPAWTFKLEGKALIASLSIDEDGIVYAWNQGKNSEGGNLTPELMAIHGPDGNHTDPYFKWTTNFPNPTTYPYEDTEWTSTVLVLNNIVVGTVTHLSGFSVGGMPMPIPTAIYNEVVGVDRETGKLLWRVPIPNEAINSPLLGPDGSIYVPVLGMLSLLKFPSGGLPSSCDSFVDKDFHGGIYQFKPE